MENALLVIGLLLLVAGIVASLPAWDRIPSGPLYAASAVVFTYFVFTDEGAWRWYALAIVIYDVVQVARWLRNRNATKSIEPATQAAS